jgi:hypothetical protein
MESLDKEEYEANNKAFYSAMISAWLNTRLERDKQLLGLSVTAIGLLVTLLKTFGVSDLVQLVPFGFAFFAFLTTVISVLCILGENAAHIEKTLDGSSAESKVLILLDKIAGISFVTGIILIVIIGMCSALINLNEEEIGMSQENSSDPHPQTMQCGDSWNGVAKLRPQPPKAAQTSPDTTPASNRLATSEGNGASNVGESGNAS